MWPASSATFPLSLDGPCCSCGSNGCWEAYISNRATLARYFGQPLSHDVLASSDRPAVHHRRSDCARTWQRRQGRERLLNRRRDISGWARGRRQYVRSRVRVHRRGNYAGVGPHRINSAIGAGRARTDGGSGDNGHSSSHGHRISASARSGGTGRCTGVRRARSGVGTPMIHEEHEEPRGNQKHQTGSESQ